MKTKETIEHISQYKAEINRKLELKGFPSCIGFTLISGRRYDLYWYNRESTQVLNTYHIASNKAELLLAIQLLLKSVNSLL
jgi:hypothetical protein